MSGTSFAWILVMMTWLMLSTLFQLTVIPWACGQRSQPGLEAIDDRLVHARPDRDGRPARLTGGCTAAARRARTGAQARGRHGHGEPHRSERSDEGWPSHGCSFMIGRIRGRGRAGPPARRERRAALKIVAQGYCSLFPAQRARQGGVTKLLRLSRRPVPIDVRSTSARSVRARCRRPLPRRGPAAGAARQRTAPISGTTHTRYVSATTG